MKTPITLLALASIISMASAAPSPAAAAPAEPQGYIDVFNVEECAEARLDEAKQFGLTEGKCTNTNSDFLSFRAGTQGSTTCPAKTKPHVDVYEEVDCGGGVMETPELAADGQTSECQDVAYDVVVLIAKSAKFVCI